MGRKILFELVKLVVIGFVGWSIRGAVEVGDLIHYCETADVSLRERQQCDNLGFMDYFFPPRFMD